MLSQSAALVAFDSRRKALHRPGMDGHQQKNEPGDFRFSEQSGKFYGRRMRRGRPQRGAGCFKAETRRNAWSGQVLKPGVGNVSDFDRVSPENKGRKSK